jgi:cell division transport system permease protein
MRGLRTFGYVFVRGVAGMRQSPLVQTVAVLTMAVCILLLGTASLLLINAQGIVEGWGVDVPLTVYLNEEVAEEDARALTERIEGLPEVTQAEFIAPEVALERLQEGLGSSASVLDGVEVQMLPTSIEVYTGAASDDEFLVALAGRLRDVKIVEEVATVGAWAKALHEGIDALKSVAIALGLLVAFACVAISWSTIRLAVFARRSEVEILRLVGGTRRFVRAPFVIEGAIQGVLGAAFAITLLAFAFHSLAPHLERGLSLFLVAGAVRFFSMHEIILAMSFGALLGVIGARIAVARYVEI